MSGTWTFQLLLSRRIPVFINTKVFVPVSKDIFDIFIAHIANPFLDKFLFLVIWKSFPQIVAIVWIVIINQNFFEFRILIFKSKNFFPIFGIDKLSKFFFFVFFTGSEGSSGIVAAVHLLIFGFYFIFWQHLVRCYTNFYNFWRRNLSFLLFLLNHSNKDGVLRQDLIIHRSLFNCIARNLVIG